MGRKSKANYIPVVITEKIEWQGEWFSLVVWILSKHHCIQTPCLTPGRQRTGSSSRPGVSNLQDLTPDDLRWSWWNNNNMHNKCNAFESSWNHLPPRSMEKLSSKKPVPGANKIGDCWCRGRRWYTGDVGRNPEDAQTSCLSSASHRTWSHPSGGVVSGEEVYFKQTDQNCLH